MPRAYAAGRYSPLLAWLEALPAEQESMGLTFAELESLIGGALPPSAYGPWYWTNSPVARTNWRRAGFRAQFDRIDRQVVFTRMPA